MLARDIAGGVSQRRHGAINQAGTGPTPESRLSRRVDVRRGLLSRGKGFVHKQAETGKDQQHSKHQHRAQRLAEYRYTQPNRKQRLQSLDRRSPYGPEILDARMKEHPPDEYRQRSCRRKPRQACRIESCHALLQNAREPHHTGYCRCEQNG